MKYVCLNPKCSARGTQQSSRTCYICGGRNDFKSGCLAFIEALGGCIGTIIGIIVIIALLVLIFKC